MEIRAYIGASLLVVQACIALALIISLRRTRNTAGISLLSETAWVVAGLGWLAYGIATSSAVLVTSGTLAALGSGAVLVCLRGSIDTAHGRELTVAGGICATITFGLQFVTGLMTARENARIVSVPMPSRYNKQHARDPRTPQQYARPHAKPCIRYRVRPHLHGRA